MLPGCSRDIHINRRRLTSDLAKTSGEVCMKTVKSGFHVSEQDKNQDLRGLMSNLALPAGLNQSY